MSDVAGMIADFKGSNFRRLQLIAGLIKENEQFVTLLRCLYLLNPEDKDRLAETAQRTTEETMLLREELDRWMNT
jgi:hypothetical protein